MPKIPYKNTSFRGDSLARIHECNTIIERYQEQGLRMTLRQLYYQLVTRNIITNEERSYKNLAKLVSEARLAGLIDWEAIEDRGRQPRMSAQWSTIQGLVDSALWSFRLPRWANQGHYVELWVEKDALAGVLRPIAERHHITLMVNKGYSSQSAMHEAANRFKEHGHKYKVLLYLGDHDPSGEDMVRDIRERLETFEVGQLDVIKVGLTMQQIRQYNPPPNPAKITDPRAKKYIQLYGNSSWEVDALPPEVLNTLIDQEILNYVDQEALDEVLGQEEALKTKLRIAARTIK